MGQAALSPITVTAPCASVTAVAYLLLDEVHWLGKGGQPSFCSRSTKCSWSVQLGNIFLTPPQKKPPKTQVPCDGWATGGRGRKKSKKKKKKTEKKNCVCGRSGCWVYFRSSEIRAFALVSFANSSPALSQLCTAGAAVSIRPQSPVAVMGEGQRGSGRGVMAFRQCGIYSDARI